MKKISVCFIGYGSHAKRINNLILNYCRSIYIYKHPKKNVFEIDDLILERLLNCDVIFITSPNSTHFYYLQLLSQKRFTGYIFCEKPPINSYEDMSIFKKLNKNKTFFGFNLRYSDFFDKANDISSRKWLGTPISLIICVGYGFAFKDGYKTSWKSSSTKSPFGVIENLGIHYIDLARSILGKISELKISQSNFAKIKNNKVPDTASIISTHKNGANSLIFVSYASPFIESMSLIGTNGLLEYSNNYLKIKSPRDTFSDDGLFISPKTIFQKKYDDDEFYLRSLKKELLFFLNLVQKQTPIPLDLFLRSKEVCQFTLKT